MKITTFAVTLPAGVSLEVRGAIGETEECRRWLGENTSVARRDESRSVDKRGASPPRSCPPSLLLAPRGIADDALFSRALPFTSSRLGTDKIPERK